MRTLCALTEVSLNSYKLWDPILRRGLSAKHSDVGSALVIFILESGGECCDLYSFVLLLFFLSKIKLCNNMYLICISSAFNALSNHSVSLLLAEYKCVIDIIFLAV